MFGDSEIAYTCDEIADLAELMRKRNACRGMASLGESHRADRVVTPDGIRLPGAAVAISYGKRGLTKKAAAQAAAPVRLAGQSTTKVKNIFECLL